MTPSAAHFDARSVDLARQLRVALTEAGFTHEGVTGLLGEEAHRALERNETTPGVRRTADGSALSTLTRLFLLQTPVPVESAQAALGELIDPLCNQGVLEQSLSEVAARMDCRPYAVAGAIEQDLWIVSDLTPGLDGAPNRVGTDHVLGISAASTSLAQLTIRDRVSRALDLGTGCGVQALHLAGHAEQVVATDVNARALWMTEFNAVLNGAEDRIEVREGSFFDPVGAEKFDLIATNPPFVISPATGERLVYRDSGLPGDRVVQDIVSKAPAHLNEGGWCQILANWVISLDQPWDERLAQWVGPEVDAFVVQREILDPAAYVELWLKDSGHHGGPDYAHRYDTWLSWLERERIAGVGFGWINLVKAGVGRQEFLEWPYEVEQPIAPAIAGWERAQRHHVGLDDFLLARPDVRQETVGAPGAADPESVILRQQTGLRRAAQADTVEAALFGACDGDLTVGQILAALAQLLDREQGELMRDYLPKVQRLVREGYLIPQ